MILTPPCVNYFNIFGLKIYFYSLCIFFAVLVSFFAMLFFAKTYKTKIQTPVLFDITPLLVIFSILGARVYYVLLSYEYFLYHPASIFMIWQGGIAIHGAIIGGIIFGALYLKLKKLPFFDYADIFTLVLPLGQAIGRWGNFFNSEAFGLPSYSFFKLFVSPIFRPLEYLNYSYFHPTFLYESFFDILIFLILIFVYKKTAEKFSGITFFVYILLYSLVRFFLEFVRIDSVFYLFGIPFPAFISFFGVLIGIIGIFIRIKR